MLYQDSIEKYLTELGSAASAPGGGSASALIGAVGAAAGIMVTYFTLDPQKYAAVEAEIRALMTDLQTHREVLQQAIEDDAVAFKQFDAVYAMPKTSSEEKAARTTAMQNALVGAMSVPLRIMTTAAAALELLPRLAVIGNAQLITDTGVAAIALRAAAAAARLNALINVKFLKDAELKMNTTAQIAALTERSATLAAATLASVEEQL